MLKDHRPEWLTGRLTIYNALDENGLEYGPPDLRYARHPL